MDYVRYLSSKATIDDRALNLRVLQSFESAVVKYGRACPRGAPLRVVEVGGGVGAMFMRLLRRRTLFSTYASLEYTLVDVKLDVLLAAQDTILRHAPALLGKDPPTNFAPSPSRSRYAAGKDKEGAASLHRAGARGRAATEICRIALTDRVSVRLVCGDAVAFLKQNKAKFDVIIGAAVMDLWDPETTLKTFFASLDKSRGLAAFYFPINFDGATDFFPDSAMGPDFDSQIEKAYHRTMGTRKVLGCDTLACHTGRRLIPCLKGMKACVKAVGGSTWIVTPEDNKTYPDDEAYFLSCIVDFIQATDNQFEENGFKLKPKDVAKYLESRRKQLSDGTLVYVAHNIDVFGVL